MPPEVRTEERVERGDRGHAGDCEDQHEEHVQQNQRVSQQAGVATPVPAGAGEKKDCARAQQQSLFLFEDPCGREIDKCRDHREQRQHDGFRKRVEESRKRLGALI